MLNRQSLLSVSPLPPSPSTPPGCSISPTTPSASDDPSRQFRPAHAPFRLSETRARSPYTGASFCVNHSTAGAPELGLGLALTAPPPVSSPTTTPGRDRPPLCFSIMLAASPWSCAPNRALRLASHDRQRRPRPQTGPPDAVRNSGEELLQP